MLSFIILAAYVECHYTECGCAVFIQATCNQYDMCLYAT
jgi:hypothetical protein